MKTDWPLLAIRLFGIALIILFVILWALYILEAEPAALGMAFGMTVVGITIKE